MKDYNLLKSALAAVEDGSVNMSRLGPLMLFKYSPLTANSRQWTPTTRACRGLILNEDGEVIARPFSKFFNINEMPETQINNLPKIPFWVEEKLDGSMGTGYLYEDQWRLATPGAFESDQAIYGTKLLKQYDLKPLLKHTTPIFEIIYPANRIVVDYGEAERLVLLSIIEHNGEEWHPNRVTSMARACGFERPALYPYKDLMDLPFTENSEGYVIHFENHFRVKNKSPLYVKVHRLLNYFTPKGVIELILGNQYGTILDGLPKGIQADFDDMRAAILTQHCNHKAVVESLFKRVPVGTRKEQALWIQSNAPNQYIGLLFCLLDGKSIDDKIYKIILEELKNEPGTQDIDSEA